MSSELYPACRDRIDEAIRRLIQDQVTPWVFMTAGPVFRIKRHDGREIVYQGIEFSGSPRQVFWSGYIEPFIKDICATELTAAVSMAHERHVDGAELIADVHRLLATRIESVYRRMAEVDQLLRGKGFPHSVDRKPIDTPVRQMHAFLDEHVAAETALWMRRPRESFYERTKLHRWILGTLIAVVSLVVAYAGLRKDSANADSSAPPQQLPAHSVDTRVSRTPAWSHSPALLHPRSAHALVSTPSSLYALAGTSASGTPVLPVERFDAATSTWSLETTLPGDGLNATAAVVLGDRILLIGGFNTTTNVPTADVLAYDLGTHAWVTAESTAPAPPPLPAPRGGHAAVVLDGKLHVLGGGNSECTLSDHSVFDPATRSWTQAAPLPRAEGSPAAVAFGSRLVVIGGRSGGSDFAEVDLYDAATDTWSAGLPLPSPRGTAGAVVYDGAIFVIGGESQARGECLSEVLRLDLAHGEWELAPPMPTARSFARAVVLGDSIYVVGGSSGPAGRHDTKGLGVVERYGTTAEARTPGH